MERLDSQDRPRPDWKQWLPVYGFFKIESDARYRRPTSFNVDYPDEHPLRFYGSAAYQAVSLVSTGGGTLYGLYRLAEYLL
jgi:hypothetical protein